MTSDPTSEVIRGCNSKNRYYTHFEGRPSISTINQRLFEVIEVMEPLEAMETVEAIEAVEAVVAVEAVEAGLIVTMT